jgi:hypothetical protein
MTAATKSPSIDVMVEYAGTNKGDQVEYMKATQAHNVVLQLARALARMAAREDDAIENGGSP